MDGLDAGIARISLVLTIVGKPLAVRICIQYIQLSVPIGRYLPLCLTISSAHPAQ